MKPSYIFLADGFEEIEALATIDLMRRAGMIVVPVSVTGSTTVTGANGIATVADILFEELPTDVEAEWLICPGGLPGASTLGSYQPLGKLIVDNLKAGKSKIAAICAAPAMVLYPLGILDGLTATCYPGCEAGLDRTTWDTSRRVVASDNIITANGPSSAFPFALAIIANSLGEDTARQIGQGTLYYA
ncbi:MAG: DJ-1/PfpI family protein [Muribaculaceae bacterium]|nr:DJ-1/PfpI family protein [Muribaculaceae bacterium]MDE6320809.1 DJ-1/PfpI family protein [Muribaculaceae bacterium]